MWFRCLTPPVVISDSVSGQDQQAVETKETTESLREFWNHGLPEIVHRHIKTLDECSKPDDCNEADKGEQFDVQFNGTRYDVSLPWKSDISNESLSNNFELYPKRLNSLHSRLKNNPKL